MTVTRTLWRIGTDTPGYTADDLSGAGAKITGGRWNRKGNAMLYTSTSIALACLETIVHLGASGLPFNRYLVKLEVPLATWNARKRIDPVKLTGWDAQPAGAVSLDAGDEWLVSLASSLLLVPSAIVPEEYNVLINPHHPETGSIKARKIRKFVYDVRLQHRGAS